MSRTAFHSPACISKSIQFPMSVEAAQEVVAEGESAPDFKLYTHDNEPWRLSDHRGEPVVLLFFPGAFTSVCTAELDGVDSNIDTFGDAEVVGISTDSPFVLSEFRSTHGWEFPLLSDHDAEVSARYGAKHEDFSPMDLDRISKRSAFVIDQHGTVQYAEVLDDAGQMPDFDAILETVDQLQQ